MTNRKHVIFTLSDERCGDFLIQHWMPSLLDNVDLTDIDVIVLDYGLLDRHRRAIQSAGLMCDQSILDGNIGTLSLRDADRILAQSSYDQAAVIDGGDIIFQADISHLFETDKESFRAVCEDIDATMHRFIMSSSDFSTEEWNEMMGFLKGKPLINGSNVFGPANKYRELWSAYREFSSGIQEYASEQLFTNYYLHRYGFKSLPAKYNFVLASTKDTYCIKNGVFYDVEGDIIPVVHNVGGKEANRYVKNFGYGKEFNKKKILTPIFRHSLGFVAKCLNRFS